MSKLLTLALLTFGSVAAVSAADAPASTATLSKVQGQPSVNQGEGFAPAQEGMRLRPGDRIMIPDASEITISFDDECKLDVEESKIVTVPERSTCAGGTLVEQALEPQGGRAIGSGAVQNGPGNVAGALIVGGWAAIGYWWLQDEDDDDTVSP